MKKPRISFIVALLISVILGIGAAVNVKIFEEIICTGNIAGATFSGTLTSCTGLPATTGIVPGTANLKLFTNAAASAPEWAAGVKLGTFTRDTAAASGTQAITGVGFKPTTLIIYGCVGDTSEVSIGFGNGAVNYNIYNRHATEAYTWGMQASTFLWFSQAGATYYGDIVSGFDADGFTINWTKTGSKTGTASLFYIAIR